MNLVHFLLTDLGYLYLLNYKLGAVEVFITVIFSHFKLATNKL